jgi:hypothetical protein
MPAPIGHSTALVGVLDAVRQMAELPAKSEPEVVERLKAMGYSEVHAEKLNAFVPSAFAWALLKRMGVSTFPNHYIALTRDGREKQLPLAQEHFFTAALRLAYQTLEHGWTERLSRETFETVISRSAEMGAANQALNANESLAGASLQALRVFRFTAEAAGEA